MKRIKTSRSAVTLVEVLIAIVIVSLIIAALMSFFSFGLIGSRRGMENLTNIGEASILMSQIELDFMRARRVLSPGSGESASEARWEVFTSEGSSGGLITYRQTARGVERSETRGGNSSSYTFCKGRSVNISFDHLILKNLPEKIDKTAVLVALSVGNSPEDARPSEEFRMIRLITCNNLPVKTEL